jgi:O-antigen biosynthesis protein
MSSPTAAGSAVRSSSGRAAGANGGPAAKPVIAMLSADVIALHVGANPKSIPGLVLEIDGRATELKISSAALSNQSGEQAGHLTIATAAEAPGNADAVLTVDLDGDHRELGPAPLRELCLDLRSFLRERLASLPRKTRAEALELLCEVAAGSGTRDPIGLAASMALAREGLREQLSTCLVERDEPQGLHFDTVIALTERDFYVRGWVRDAQAELTRLTAVSPEGARIELLDSIHRNRRPDVDSFYEQIGMSNDEKSGFLAYLQTPVPSHASEGWVLEMENALAVEHEVAGPTVNRNLIEARAGILSDLERERHWDTPLMDQVAPAVSRIQDLLDESTEIEEVLEFGTRPSSAEVSIVVPLYGRIDFLEHQLAQFVHDPEMREADLIYVLDSPELAPALEKAASELFDLYRVPFRVAILSRNGGYSVANNRGASLAEGRLLLLLNSDVLPDQPGWLSRMTAFYDDKDEIGALGPKLLFEDDTLQHAGICFRRPPDGGAWENEHYFKGLHRDLAAANVTRPVPAVSGACLMISRELYEELEGLRGMYVQGDYEDTDLCLRLRDAGRKTWYLPEVELYHLEGQSYSLETRTAMSRYNVWLHSRLWDEEIQHALEDDDVMPADSA